MSNTEIRFKKPAPMSDHGVAILIGLFILSFTVIYTFVDGWPALMGLLPLAIGCLMFGYLYGSMGIITREPRFDADD